ncbi:B12-binding domain-containing radical SAM protein [Flavobacterium silvaticum]|uniref:Radical SAM protein n=1 Tax=Flavobacterium silvaticum TaxID=1852020 RepID=A0A972JIP3_9FLAO|nr:radical SAM protein [Flavobacterium silvaticum]NMH29265.1 radical SAM protein [Flavobacterium silvaticum]
MNPGIFLLTPPFTQLNTPYPATAYLKGFLNTKEINSVQADLGIDVILGLFSKPGLQRVFDTADLTDSSDNSKRIFALKQEYLKTIDSVILFLQGQNPTLALQICQEDYLPEASRFSQLEELDWAFGAMGLQDKAKHLATLYLEDLSDFIVECVDENFGFSRYAERLGRSANSFDEIYNELDSPLSYIDTLTIEILEAKLQTVNPDLVLMSVPFPGNLFSAFRCAQYIRENYPTVKIAMGGGFPNTELRSLSDSRVFEFFDFITLDDGELPVELLIDYVQNGSGQLKRTFLLEDAKVVFRNDSAKSDYKQSQVGTPDYSNLPMDKYISVIEIVNPMHRMWSDGRWNKLTMAHGCYWGKCTFCDISLDYIKIYEPVAANLLCDRMEELIVQTGQNGFHFVDEAAPPALMRALALEILRRKLSVTWWTNIRFEKSFTRDLCVLLKASGCIAVSGGLEVASDRLLQLIDKGVTVAQVANVTRHFTENGIMVHAYLMYGYPTQTVQETVDSLEMVRQLFEAGVLQSGFWHQFAMTAHSPVGLYPEQFGVKKKTEKTGAFANNDIDFSDATGIDHNQFSFGLKKSLYNFMYGIGLDFPLNEWFDFKIPRTTIRPDFIESSFMDEDELNMKPTAKIVWIGGKPQVSSEIKTKKGRTFTNAVYSFHTKKDFFTIRVSSEEGEWLEKILDVISVSEAKTLTLGQFKNDYENSGLEDFELFWFSKSIRAMRANGLLIL